MPADVPETTYFIYYSHGEKPATPCAFSLYFKVTHKFFFYIFFLPFICDYISTSVCNDIGIC